MSTTKTKVSVNNEVSKDPFQGALDHYRAEMAALSPGELTAIHVDVPTAVTTVTGALPRLALLRTAIVDALPHFDLRSLDGLKGYTLALAQAHSAYLSETDSGDLRALTERATKLRDVLATDGAALAARGLIDAKRFDEIKGAAGYRHLAFELLGLSTLLLENMAAITGKSALTGEELEQARGLAAALIEAIGARDQTAAKHAHLADDRQRIFTLFYRAYNDTREAVAYVRRKEHDADAFAPSLFAGRGRHKVVAKPNPAPAPTSGTTTSPITTKGANGNAPAPATATTTSGAPAASTTAATAR